MLGHLHALAQNVCALTEGVASTAWISISVGIGMCGCEPFFNEEAHTLGAGEQWRELPGEPVARYLGCYVRIVTEERGSHLGSARPHDC